MRPVCSQLTVSGRPCKATPMRGSDRCSAHLGLSHRHVALKPETIDQLAAMLRAGCHDGVALKACAVPRSTFGDWMRRGLSTRPADELFRELRARVEQARAQGEARLVALLAREAEEDWRVAAWMLERRYPERWARYSQRVEADRRAPADRTAVDAALDPFAELDELAAVRARRGAG